MVFLLILFASFSFIGVANAQTEDVTLVFKRPFIGAGDWHTSKISINGKEVCALDSDSDKIVSCTTRVRAGEIAIKVTSARGSDFNYVIDVVKGKTYTLVVYVRNMQSEDMIWSNMNLIQNKVDESEDYNRMSFKTQVISIK